MATEELIISGLACIGIAAFLFYRLISSRGPGDEMSRLELRTKQLKDLIKTTRLDFYRRRIEGDKADKLIREYEEELSLASKQIDELRRKYGGPVTSARFASPKNIATLAVAIALLITGLLLMANALSRAPGEESTNMILKKSPSDCSSISDLGDRDRCYKNMMEKIITEDPQKAAKYCDMLFEAEMRNECYRRVSIEAANQNISLSLELCGKIDDEADSKMCYWDLFQKSKDIIMQYPDRVLDLCGLLSEGNSNDCFYMVAENIVSTSLQEAIQACLKITGVNRRDDCLLNGVMAHLENPLSAIRICRDHISKNRREDCFRSACSDEFIMENPAGAREYCCGSMEGTMATDCYVKIARITAPSDLNFAIETCGMIKGFPFGRSSEDCYRLVMRLVENISQKITVCQHVSGGWSKESCLQDLLWSAETCQEVTEICDYIDDLFCAVRSIIGDDYGRRARECPQLAIGLCLDLPSDQQVWDCLQQLAGILASDNPSMARKACNEIEDKRQRDACKDRI